LSCEVLKIKFFYYPVTGQSYILIGSIPIYATCLQLFCVLGNLNIKEALIFHDFLCLIAGGNSATGAIAGGVAAGAALLFAAPAIAFAWWRRRKPQEFFFDVPGELSLLFYLLVHWWNIWREFDSLHLNSAEEDPEVHLGQLKRFSLRELQVATDTFSNKNILGRGGFGKVYKGRLADGSLVAVKRLKEERTPGGELQFQTEVEMISMAVHRNLLRLRGFCMTTTERLLVYPYMANGSVASCLRGMAFAFFSSLWHSNKVEHDLYLTLFLLCILVTLSSVFQGMATTYI